MADRHILIVGGGIAGLSAGITLLQRGFACEIFEKNGFAGGNLCGWDRNGFHIDNCVHWLTGTREGTRLRALWEELGALRGEEDVVRPRTFYASSDGSRTLAFSRSLAETREAFLQNAPKDEKELLRFFGAAEKLARADADGTLSARLQRLSVYARFARKSLGGLAAKLRSPLVRDALTDLFTERYSSLGLLLSYAAFVSGNADLPAGGSRAMACRVAERFRSLGGVLHTGCEATGLRLRGNALQAVIADGNAYCGDGVILACDPAAVFGRLLPAELAPSGLRRVLRDERKYPVYSAFQAAWEVPVRSLPFRGTLVFPTEPFGAGENTRSRVLLREYSHEKGFAPEEKTVVQTILPQSASDCREWIRLRAGEKDGYRERKAALADALSERIRRAFPSAGAGLRLLDAWTPASYQRYFSSRCGAFMSYALTGEAIPVPIPPRVKGISNLFLAGQWYRPPGGLPSAAMSGRNAALAAERALTSRHGEKDALLLSQESFRS